MLAPVPIKESIVQTSPSLWRLGSTVECERVATPKEPCLATWKDGKSWYTLRTAPPEEPSDIVTTNSNDFHLIHEGGTMSAVWAIGNHAICKVQHWDSDTSSEK